MRIEINRVTKENTYTIGKMSINGKYLCDTLEDKDRGLSQDTPLSIIKSVKVPNETAIPTGKYKVIVNMSPKFKRMLPRLLNVPGFEGVLIHRGNTDKDSAGCILVGENKVKGKVLNSTTYEVTLVKMLTEAQNNKEEIVLEIS